MEKQASVEKQVISIEDLRKVKGIGPKAIERIKEQIQDSEEVANYVSKYNGEKPLELNQIHLGDCLDLMNGIPDGSVDMILADLPYGTTACRWDTIIPFIPLWGQYERVIKDNGAIVLTASQPFTSALVMSNPKLFRYEWVWDKVKPSTGLHAKHQPLRQHESVLIFSKRKATYKPIMTKADERKGTITSSNGEAFGGATVTRRHDNGGKSYPRSILTLSNANQRGKVHPTQKPISLMEHLIKTYTNEGDTVLDNVIGSGTTAIAAINTSRNFIGIEMDETYHKLATERVAKHVKEQ